MTGCRKKLLLLAVLPLFVLMEVTADGQDKDQCSKYWRARIVFTGRIAKTRRSTSKAYSYVNGVEHYSKTPVLRITFQIETVFKGFNRQRSLAPLEVECADCLNQNNMHLGENYLVYASGVGPKGGYPLATVPPIAVSQASDEIQSLQKLTAPGTIAHELNKLLSNSLLSGRAISMPRPNYPEVARTAKVSGTVTVAIVLDSSGKVVRAEAVCGHPLLRATSEAAAKLIMYTPTKINGSAIPMGGIVTYNFVAQ